MNKTKITMLVIGGLIALAALAFGLEMAGLQWRRFFAPRHENVNREVFKATRSYNEAKTQDLARYRLQYEKGNPEEKEAIASTIRIMFADYDRDLLPNELSSFLYKIRGY